MDHVSALSTKPLSETKSGCPDTQREAAWLMRKKEFRHWQRRRCKSFTDFDLDELRACIELGFGFEFDSADLDLKLSSAFPALDFYFAVNKQFHSRSDSLSRSSSSVTVASSDSDTSRSSAGSSSSSLFEPGQENEIEAVGAGGGMHSSTIFAQMNVVLSMINWRLRKNEIIGNVK